MKTLRRMHARKSVRPNGAASVEFSIISLWAFIPLMMALVQMGLYFVAKNTVNMAAFSVARAGAASGMDPSQMKVAYAKAIAPLYVAKGLFVTGNNQLHEVSNGNYWEVGGAAYAYAYGLVTLPGVSSLNYYKIINPTAAAFDDFGISYPDPSSSWYRQRVIPTTNLATDNAVGANTKQRRSDALLLKVEVHHCYPMIMPLIDKLVYETMNILAPTNACAIQPAVPGVYEGSGNNNVVYGIDIVSQGVVRMTVPPLKANLR